MRVFADTAYFIALLNGEDAAHVPALAYSRQAFREIVVTEFVLLELADAFSRPPDRADFLVMDEYVRMTSAYRIIPATSELLQRGRDLFAARPDKAWSLTDCISFLVMQDHDLIEALTTDHHFTQAGFKALLAAD
ncbi:MAG: PIN domain-containing protein [Verrucomicrobiaceae bacterium]